jgi:hypothetical protein
VCQGKALAGERRGEVVECRGEKNPEGIFMRTELTGSYIP